MNFGDIRDFGAAATAGAVGAATTVGALGSGPVELRRE
jgi:hypothetical protein